MELTFVLLCLRFNSSEKREGRKGTERTESTKGTKGQEGAKAKEGKERWHETIEIEFLKEIRKLKNYA